MSNDTDKIKNPHANIQIKSLDKSLLEEQDRQIAEFKPQQVAGPDDSGIHAHKPLSPEQLAAAHVTDKVYMFPESYTALRRELSEHWPNLWALVAWRMAFKAEEFMEYMNEALDLRLQFDTQKVDAICKIYLDALRKKRGISSVH
jgi:hypothetical protein